MTGADLERLGYFPKPELVAKKWFTRIELSPTIPMLRYIGKLIAESDLGEEYKPTAREFVRGEDGAVEMAIMSELIKAGVGLCILAVFIRMAIDILRDK